MKLTLTALLSLISVLQAREFTDSQGRKIDAEILAATETQVTLKRTSDGRSFTVPTNSFSSEDQAFIKQYAADNLNYSFEIRHQKKKMDESKVDSGGMIGTIEKWGYEISIRNLSRVDVNSISAKYWIFKKSMAEKGRMESVIESSNSITLEPLARNATVIVQTKTIELARVRAKRGYYFKSGENSKSDQMSGLVLKLYKDGNEIFQHASDQTLLDKAR